jgi:hypothetical protein
LFSVNRAARKNKNPTLEDWMNVEKKIQIPQRELRTTE